MTPPPKTADTAVSITFDPLLQTKNPFVVVCRLKLSELFAYKTLARQLTHSSREQSQHIDRVETSPHTHLPSCCCKRATETSNLLDKRAKKEFCDQNGDIHSVVVVIVTSSIGGKR